MKDFSSEDIVHLLDGGSAQLSGVNVIEGGPTHRFIIRMCMFLGWKPNQKRHIPSAGVELLGSVTIADNKGATEGDALRERVAVRIQQEEEKNQRNMEVVSFGATPNIKEDAKPEDVDEDWLANFFDKCRRVSNEDMQKLWSQILAGEVNKPGSFSKRTINFLETMTQAEANLFLQFTSCIWTTEGGISLSIIFKSSLRSSAVITFKKLMDLRDLGLIYFKDDDIGLATKAFDIELSYRGRKIIVTKPGDSKSDMMAVGHVKLTQMGQELSRICELVEAYDYYDLAIGEWKKRKYKIKELSA